MNGVRSLAHGQLVPGPALLMSPFTAAFGPVVSYNLIALASPVLASFCAFLLCLHLTKRTGPSLIGGYLFGFSTYMLGQMVAHLHLTLVFLVPAIVHLTLLAIEGRVSQRRYLLGLTAALVGQFLISPEVFLTFTIFGLATAAIGFVVTGPEERSAILRLIPAAAGAYVATAIVVGVYLYYALKPGGVPVLPGLTRAQSNDLLSFALPTRISWLGRHLGSLTSTYTAGTIEGGAYLGLPILFMVSVFAVSSWRRATTKLLVAVFAVTAVASMGPRLHVGGAVTVPLPWRAVSHLPLVGLALPDRLAVYATLAAAVMSASWLAAPSRTQSSKWLLASLAVLALAPNLGQGFWHGRLAVPGFFSSGVHKKYLKPTDSVLIPPIGDAGNDMLWHAKAGLDFRLVGGYVYPPYGSNPYKRDPLYPALTTLAPVPNAATATRRFLTRNSVTAIVLDPRNSGRWPATLARLGLTPVRIGGVLFYRVPG